MKYIKMLGLLAVAAAALMAFAGSASATLTEAAGDPSDIGDKIHAVSLGSTSLTGTITVTCEESTVEGEVTENGATTAGGPVTSLTFGKCGNHTVTVTEKGSLSLHNLGNNTGTLTSTGAKVTILLHSAFLGTVHCIYTTNGTDIGEVTGSGHPNNPTPGAKLHIKSISLTRAPTDGACGEHSTWEGTYETSSYLSVD